MCLVCVCYPGKDRFLRTRWLFVCPPVLSGFRGENAMRLCVISNVKVVQKYVRNNLLMFLSAFYSININDFFLFAVLPK